MRAIIEWYLAARLTWHDIRREWCEERGNPRSWHHRERVRYYANRLMTMKLNSQ